MAAMAKLVYSVREGEPREVPIKAGEDTTIGRHPSCTLTIAQPSVSRRHAKLYFEAGGVYFEDMGSSNGSFVNNQRIQRSSLTNGDNLRCGDFKFQYVEHLAPSTREQPPAAFESAAPRKIKPRVVGTLRPRRSGSESPKTQPNPPPPLPGLATELPGAASTNKAEVETLRQELVVAQQATERVREDSQLARKEAAESREDARHKSQRVQELETEAHRATEQIDTLTDRSLRLREQVQSQQNQLEEYRREKIALEVDLTDARASVGALEGAQSASGSRENELADNVNDLKREVRQKVKDHKDVERQLDLAEYNLNAAREENENLRLALGDDDSRRRDLNTTLTDLQQVLQEKEGMIDALQADNNRLARELEHLSAAGGDVAALRARLVTAEAESEESKRVLAERASITGRQAVEQLNQLKRDNRQLRNTLSDLQAQSQASPDQAQLEARLFAAERERDSAQSAQRESESRYASKAAEVAKLRAAPAGSVPAAAPQSDGLLEEAIANFEALNDLASGLRMNVEVSVSLTQELRPFVVLASNPRADLAQIAKLAQEVEALFTLESLEGELENAETGARASKKAMRRFREVLKARGYGS